MNPAMTRRGLIAAISASAAMSAGLAPAMAQAKGGVLNALCHPEPPTLILGLDVNGPTQLVAGKIFESLLSYDFDFSPLPSLAKSWEIADDGLTYTFHLQQGVTWHDGKPFSADDVVFTITEFLADVHPRAKGVFANCSSVTALDPNTVQFKLKQIFAPFMLAFEISTSPILPAHLYRGTDFRKNPNNEKAIGTGPFKLAEWRHGSFIHLVKNPAYYRPGEPHLDEIYFHLIPDSASRALAVEQGVVQHVQYGQIEPYDAQRLRKSDKFNFIDKGIEFYGPINRIEFNTRIGPFADKRFRQAINYALDRQFILDNIFLGVGKISDGAWNSRTRFHSPASKPYPLDVAKAKALLDEMGLKPKADGTRANVTLLKLPTSEEMSRLAEYIQQSLHDIGIVVELQSADFAGWTTRYGNWDFQMTINQPYQYGDPALGIARFFLSSNIRKGVPYTNCSGYSSPELDALFAKGVSTINDAERQAAYFAVQKILNEDVPMAWLTEYEQPMLIDKHFSNCIVSAIGLNETYRQAVKAT